MAKRKKTYDFGECHVCGERMEPGLINQEFWIKGKLVVMEAVPAGVCAQCGEKVVSGEFGRAVASLIASPKRRRPTRVLRVPVSDSAKPPEPRGNTGWVERLRGAIYRPAAP